MSNEKSLLEIAGLSIAFQKRRVLDRLDLNISAGEILALVGESGAGKTLAALAIVGLLPPQATILDGRILYRGENLLDLNEKELRQIRGCEIGLVFQDPRTALNPVMRIEKQLCEGMRYRLHYGKQEALEQGIRLLEAVGIQESERCLRAYPHQLSGGMRQRVLLAAALSCKPRLLICDEVTSAVDSIVQSQLLALLASLRARYKVAILLITHNLWAAHQVADRVSVLLRGKVVEEGSAESIFTQPAHPFTRSLIASHPVFEER